MMHGCVSMTPTSAALNFLPVAKDSLPLGQSLAHNTPSSKLKPKAR
jgi:hypothetical protein